MKAYKGFHKTADGKLECNGFIFEEGKTYVHDGEVELCKSGFHACEKPLDCFRYYPPNKSEYHEVDLEDVSDKISDDSKRVGGKITIGKKLSVADIGDIQTSVVRVNNTSEGNYSVNTSEGNYSANTSKGWHSVNTSKGDYSANTSKGNYSVNTSKGWHSVNTSVGDYSANTSKGNYSVNTSVGDYSVNTSKGNYSANTSKGWHSVNTSVGNYSANTSKGYGSANVSLGAGSSNEGSTATLNAAWGRNSKCRGDIGAYLVISEWGEWDGKKCPLLGAQMVYVDGESVKANTWYELKNGEVLEAEG